MRFALLFAAIAASSLVSQTLFLSDQQGSLFAMNPATSAATLVGSTLPVTSLGLAHDGTTLFCLDFGSVGAAVGGLYAINPGFGATTLMGSTGMTGWQDFTWDPTTNHFFAVNQNGNLYSISMAGVASLIGSTNTVPPTFPVPLLASLALDAAGTLWTINYSTGALATLSKSTGTLSVVHQTNLNTWQAIAFHPVTGVLYGIRTFFGSAALYTIDVATGSATLVGGSATINGPAGLRFVPNVCPAPQFQVNSAAATVTLNGVAGTPCTAAITNVSGLAPVTAAFSSVDVGFGWEVIVSPVQLIPVSAGAFVTADGQILNINLTGPPLLFLNGGTVPSFATPFPGNFSFVFPAPLGPATISIQMVVLDPIAPSGFRLSHGCQLAVL